MLKMVFKYLNTVDIVKMKDKNCSLIQYRFGLYYGQKFKNTVLQKYAKFLGKCNMKYNIFGSLAHRCIDRTIKTTSRGSAGIPVL